MTDITRYAKIYTERYNWHLVPIEPGRKFPLGKDWGNKTLTEPAQAIAFWQSHNDYNMGLALGPSRMCSLDIDDAAAFQAVLDDFGISSDELAGYPTIKGKGTRIMFRVPDDMQLPYCKLNWPSKDDPKKHFTVFELRSCGDDKQRQDVLPPSMHPDTGKPYEWIVKPPKSMDGWPMPPKWLLAVWSEWQTFKPQFVDSCPWVTPEIRKAPPTPTHNSSYPDVSGAYNAQNRITQTLERYGYQRKGRRYLSPHSSTGLAGVHVIDSERCYIHHASDPLCSTESGHPVSSFDLYVYYDHNGDRSKAYKAAAHELGIELSKPRTLAPQQASEPPNLPPVTIDQTRTSCVDVNPLRHVNGNGKPLAHIDNLREIIKRIGVTLRYNVITKDEEILIPGESFSLDNQANAALAWLVSECSLFQMPTAKLPDFITYLADKNQYNPVAEWVTCKQWDGTDRLTNLLNTVTVTDDANAQLKDTLIKRWMISAIAGAFNATGVSAHGVLTFQGEQYVGKTKWFKSLVPDQLNLTKDGIILKPDDRDSVKQATSFWLVELGELDSTFRKSDIAALKAFLTQDRDVYRKPYARTDSRHPRRTVFFASVNPKQFLHDPTGNRRYWTIPVKHLDHSHDIDMQQVWAQVYESLYLNGESHYLTADEMLQLNGHNEDFTASDPIEDIIINNFEWSMPESYWRWITATAALIECGHERPTKLDVNTAASCIRKQNGNRGKRTGAGKMLFVAPRKLEI